MRLASVEALNERWLRWQDETGRLELDRGGVWLRVFKDGSVHCVGRNGWPKWLEHRGVSCLLADGVQSRR